MAAQESYPYGAKASHLVIAAVFFGVCGAFFVWAASSGREVRLWPLAVSVTGAPVYLFAALSLGFVAVAIAQLARARKLGPRRLVITDDYLEAPRTPWTHQTLRVDRQNLRGAQQTEFMRSRVLVMETTEGKLALSNRTVGEDGYAAAVRWVRRAR